MKKFLIVTFFLFAFAWILFSIYKISSTTAPDFSVLWLIAKDFWKVSNPYLNPQIYTPSGYPPFTYLLYLPLSFFSQTAAQWIFSIISLAAIFGSIYFSFKLILKKFTIYDFLFASALSLISFPVKFTLGMGQVNAIVLFLIIFSYYLSLGKKSFWAGFLLGISIVFKPVTGFFVLFYILRGKWKVVSYSLLSVLIAFLISTIGYGLSLWNYWVADIIVPLMNFAGREVYYNQGFLGLISRLTSDISIRKISEPIIAIGFTFPLIFFRKTKNELFYLSLFFLTLLLADSLSWQHHFVWLIFPYVLTVYWAIKLKKGWILFLLILSYLLVSWNFRNPKLVPAIFLSNTFYGAIILYFLNLNNNR